MSVGWRGQEGLENERTHTKLRCLIFVYARERRWQRRVIPDTMPSLEG